MFDKVMKISHVHVEVKQLVFLSEEMVCNSRFAYRNCLYSISTTSNNESEQ